MTMPSPRVRASRALSTMTRRTQCTARIRLDTGCQVEEEETLATDKIHVCSRLNSGNVHSTLHSARRQASSSHNDDGPTEEFVFTLILRRRAYGRLSPHVERLIRRLPRPPNFNVRVRVFDPPLAGESLPDGPQASITINDYNQGHGKVV